MVNVKEILDGYLAGSVTVVDDAPAEPDECKPPAGMSCIGGWHFKGDTAVKRCDTKRRREIREKIVDERARLEGPLELLKQYGGAKFDGYDPSRHAGADRALAAMRAFSEGRPPRRNVLLVSPNGLGKTRLLLASHFALLDAGIASRYVTTPELRKWFKRADSFDEEVEREARNWLERFNYAQAIHFDDAGHVENDQRSRGAFAEGLKGLLDNTKAAWAVATNRSSSEMETHPDLSGTVASRFQYNADVIVMSGIDFRTETAR